MAEQAAQTTVRKKAEAGKVATDGAPMSAERALGQALARVAQDQLELPLQLRSLKQARMTLADLPEVLEDLSLLAVLEGPKDGLGLMVLPPATLSALIEVQTMGRLGAAAPSPRRPTRIDAAMAADFIDAVLAELEAQLAGHEAISWAGGFRYGSFLDDPRPLGLMFEDITYRVWTVELGFGAGGEREGTLLWVVPATGRGARPQPQVALALAGVGEAASGPLPAETEEAAAAEWAGQMETAVLAVRAELGAVLHRLQLPLQAVMEFRPGTEIPVPMAALDQIRVEGAGRRFLSLARLGQQGGNRAVRMVDAEVEPGAMPGGRRRGDPQPFNAGASPFPQIDPSELPDMGTLGGLTDPNSSAYDMPAPAPMATGLDASGGLDDPGGLDGLNDLGGFGGLDEAGGELPPLGMALDGFDPGDADDPLKTGSDG